MVRKTLYLAGLFLIFQFCSHTEGLDKKEKISTNFPKWFEGNYEYISNYGVYRECWVKRTAHEFIGKGYFLHKGDTSFLMKMRLYEDSAGVKMDYNVKGQNNGTDVVFILTKYTDGIYVFENPFRGFPSVMQYKITSDSLITVIEKGFENNKAETREFTVHKIADIK